MILLEKLCGCARAPLKTVIPVVCGNANKWCRARRDCGPRSVIFKDLSILRPRSKRGFLPANFGLRFSETLARDKMSQLAEQAAVLSAGRCGSLPELFVTQAARFGGKPLFWQKDAGQWRSTSWAVAERHARALARWLIAQGVEAGDRVILVSENRAEWAIADLGIMMAGALSVPAYTTHTTDDHRHLLQDSGAVGVICSTDRLFARVAPAARDSESCRWAVLMARGHAERATVEDSDSLPLFDWDSILNARLAPREEARMAGLNRDETACLIYTSGTGGTPKGVMLSHRAILHNVVGAQAVISLLGIEQEVFLSFLPLSHSYEHTAGLYYPIFCGAEIYYAPSLETLIPTMAEVRPTLMTAVPRFYDIIYRRLMQQMDTSGTIGRALMRRTIALGRRALRQPDDRGLFERLQNCLLDRLVRRKIRARFGGRLRALVSGGAALDPEIGETLMALGLPILQGYGQTETGPVVSVNRPGSEVSDATGPPLEGVSVKIAPDGEILVTGDLVMNGYWNNAAATAATLRDGWVHTGDIGCLTPRGHIQITDRKKDIIVLSNGENVAPARLEGLLTQSGALRQAVVFGEKYLVAVVVPSEDFLDHWGDKRRKPALLAEVHDDPALHLTIAKVIDDFNKQRARHERIRRFMIAPEAFKVENGFLTPTIKIKRHKVLEHYWDEIQALHSAPERGEKS